MELLAAQKLTGGCFYCCKKFISWGVAFRCWLDKLVLIRTRLQEAVGRPFELGWQNFKGKTFWGEGVGLKIKRYRNFRNDNFQNLGPFIFQSWNMLLFTLILVNGFLSFNHILKGATLGCKTIAVTSKIC